VTVSAAASGPGAVTRPAGPADAGLVALPDCGLLAGAVLTAELLAGAGPEDALLPGEGGAMGDVVASSVTTVSFHASASSRPALN
jgi:hypothetical protein